MSDIEKASADATEAAQQSDAYALALAMLHTAQQAQQPACQHQRPAPAKSSGSAVKWLAVGMGGSALILSVAVSAVAVAVSAVALTVCLLVLRSVWQDMRKGR